MLTLQERVANYALTFPKFPPPIVGSDGRIQGIWILGNDYRAKNGYYGEFPPNYLKRILALFPDIAENQTLNLFSGSSTYGITFDSNNKLKPNICGDAHQLTSYFNIALYDQPHLILADPPYSSEDAEHYGTPMVKRNTIVEQCYQLLHTEGFLVWLDQVLPMYSKTKFALIGVIGVIRSTNHRVRAVFIFQKQTNEVVV